MAVDEKETHRYALSQISYRRFIYNTVAIVSDPASHNGIVRATYLGKLAPRQGNDSCTPLLHACSLLASHGVRACAYGCIRRRVTSNIGRENFNVSTAFNPSRGLLRWSPLIAMRNHFQPMNHPLERSTCRLFASSVFRHPRETDISAIRMQRRTRWTWISSSNASIQVEIFLPSTFFFGLSFSLLIFIF